MAGGNGQIVSTTAIPFGKVHNHNPKRALPQPVNRNARRYIEKMNRKGAK